MFEGKGLIIDKEKGRYKKYVSFLLFRVGEWKKLPTISFIAFTKVDGTQSMHSARTMGNSVTFKVELYCVYLCIDLKRKILVLKSKNKQEALRLATDSAKYLNIDLSNFVKED